LQNLPQTGSQAEANKLKDAIETDLFLIGATAVLDRLQEDVPETIRDLIRGSTICILSKMLKFGC
jgi:magnesium-transporting ATPase (P-type)